MHEVSSLNWLARTVGIMALCGALSAQANLGVVAPFDTALTS